MLDRPAEGTHSACLDHKPGMKLFDPGSGVKSDVSQLQQRDLIECLLSSCFAGPTCGQGQARAIVGLEQLSGHQQDAVVQGLERGEAAPVF